MIRGKDLISYLVVFIISLLGGLLIIPCDFELVGELITFLSILYGFQLTSLSILFNSNFLNKFYDLKDKTYKNKLIRLKIYFEFNMNFILLSIFLLLVLPHRNIFLFDFEKNIKFVFVLPILSLSLLGTFKISKTLFGLFVVPRNN